MDQSGHNYIRSKRLNSLALKDYLLLLEDRFCSGAAYEANPASEIDQVDTFIKLVEQEKEVFYERAVKLIEYQEMTPYQVRQKKLEDEKAAKLAEE